MPHIFAIVGIVFQVMGLVLDLYLMTSKRTGKIADMYLLKYKDDEVIPDVKARELINMAIKMKH